MDCVKLERTDLKQYWHFDAKIPLWAARKIVESPVAVAQHAYYPFLRYFNSWQPFRGPNSEEIPSPKRKRRPIRYAARKDAYIYTHYRRQLANSYENVLKSRMLGDCVLAYRRIQTDDGRGMCNIDFANSAFNVIRDRGDCVVISMDIDGFFESLDHRTIRRQWCSLLGVESLPKDHYAIFKNVTRYRYVDQDEVFDRLGIKTAGDLLTLKNRQLCSPTDFRRKICGEGGHQTSIVKKNREDYGIPQGTPISDLIANFYLIEFDSNVNDFIEQHGGKYMRYSDDILMIIPGGPDVSDFAIKFVEAEIANHGRNLCFKTSKTAVLKYFNKNKRLTFEHLKGKTGRNGVEYLGFRFDGLKVYIRDSSLANFYRKVTFGLQSALKHHIYRNPEQSVVQLAQSFNYQEFRQRFMQVAHWKEKADEFGYQAWNFYSYLRKCHHVFNQKKSGIRKQVRHFDRFVEQRTKQILLKLQESGRAEKIRTKRHYDDRISKRN